MRIPALVVSLFLLAACNSSTDKKDDNKSTNQTDDQMPQKPVGEDTVFTGFGNEPFWSVHIINNEKIVFHPADGPDLTVPVGSDFYPDSISYSYGGSVNATTILLTVNKKNCSDGMSDITHPYEVSLLVNKVKYNGCGRGGR